uniref:ER lumen protein retaining receptor n=1 Tax=Arundo donax TaxID=35708 RepID=A0A0A9H987_ARUDO
MKTTFITEL